MDRFIRTRISRFKKDSLLFWKIFEKQPERLVSFFLISFLFFFLPGQNFYQTEKLKVKEPLARAVEIEVPSPAPYPTKVKNIPPPEITAISALVLDFPSKVIMFEKNPSLRLSPASVTKIMTALIALEIFDLNEILTVKRPYPEGTQMGLVDGEKIAVESLLYGLLLNSGNDAAFALAEGHEKGIEQFIADMNKKAIQLGLNDTNFVNPTGADEEDHFSTVWDLAHLSAYALGNPIFAKIVGTDRVNVANADGTHWYALENINILLDRLLGVKGVKTGWTEEAGGCLVTYIEREEQEIITVVLKSKDEETRFEDSIALINWTFTNHEWVDVGVNNAY
jgi:D-alanyl-D-alanine carboxypeptidase (penicillin-binding protein 5/6)